MEIKDINWNQMWIEAMARSSAKNRNVDHWDELAKRQSKWLKKDDYAQKIMERITLNKEWTVLDIGSGAGALSIPMAAQVKMVTALDVSAEMLHFLKEKAAQSRLSNIHCVNASWNDVKLGKDIEQHDVVFASRYILFEPQVELTKMDRAAKRCVYVTWRASDRKFDKAVYEFLGRNYHELPDYLHLYNILHQMGIYASVEFIECRSRILYRGIEDAMEDWRWKILNLRPEEEAPLRQYLLKSLTETDEGTLEAPDERTKWALIAWEK